MAVKKLPERLTQAQRDANLANAIDYFRMPDWAQEKGYAVVPIKGDRTAIAVIAVEVERLHDDLAELREQCDSHWRVRKSLLTDLRRAEREIAGLKRAALSPRASGIAAAKPARPKGSTRKGKSPAPIGETP